MIKRRLALLTILALASGVFAWTAIEHRELDRADLEAWLDGFMPRSLELADIAGAVVLVLKDGRVLLQKGYGYADVAREIPFDPELTMLGVGSVSKLFTWTAVMQQVGSGALDLDRDINDYLDFKIPRRFGRPITLRNLLTHTAGFEERLFRQLPADAAPRSLGEYLKGVPVPERIDPPGELLAYSNYGAMLAGHIVEIVSAEPFVDYVERHILRPLGMERSTFQRPLPDPFAKYMAQHYHLASGETLPPDNEEPAGDPSGHLSTTASDISRFMLAHLQRGAYGEVKLLSPEMTQLMHAPAFYPLPGAPAMALGFFRGDYNGRRVLAHAGDLTGFHADLELLPDEGVGFFIGLNSDGLGGPISASHHLRTALFRNFMDRYFPAPPSPDEPTTPTAKEHARVAAGEYEMSRRPEGDFMKAFYLAARIAVRSNDDGTIETPGLLSSRLGRPQRWREIGPFIWREVGGRARLHMKVENGRVKAWLSDDLYSFVLRPVPPLTSAALNLPLLAAAAAALVLTALLGPVSAQIRRRCGLRNELDKREARAARLARLAAMMGAVYVAGWGVVLMADVPSKAGSESWIRLVQLIGLLCGLGAGAAIWNTWLTFKGRRHWGARIESLTMALALLYLMWFSFVFKLISIGLNY
jgi:CubicO group peptidase (beta-lactamase class C family)